MLEGARRIVFADGNLDRGHTLTVDGSSAINGMILNASREASGSFHMIGGEGDDQLIGGGGRDTLEGSAGKDALTGGAKADHFVISVLALDGPATITDLEAQDTIDLHLIDANTARDGDQRFKLVESFTGHAGQAVLSYDGVKDVTLLSLDVDGDGQADGVVAASGNHQDFHHFLL